MKANTSCVEADWISTFFFESLILIQSKDVVVGVELKKENYSQVLTLNFLLKM